MFYHYLRGYPYFAIMTVSIDQWCAGIGLFMEKSVFQLRYLKLIFVYPRYVKTLSHYPRYVKTFSHLIIAFIYSFFCFYSVTEMLNTIQDQRKVKSFLFLVVTGM